MKLRNKKTGEILEDVRSAMTYKGKIRIYDEITDKYFTYNSLAELNAEWEDYEEPKEYWFVDSGGEVEEVAYLTDNDKTTLKKFGNYFKTREEAEAAVKKLEAWKRLKDAGFKFINWYGGSKTIAYEFKDKPEGYIPVKECADLDLLFGGEE